MSELAHGQASPLTQQAHECKNILQFAPTDSYYEEVERQSRTVACNYRFVSQLLCKLIRVLLPGPLAHQIRTRAITLQVPKVTLMPHTQ